ncbi:ryncolin-1-like [Wyeomyia smithii]|uniref:ryncolin-1-like n=1 Tax=Wyeomyia smithii TaxID=174621 RepID=UPI002467BB85|nr:ryncolin-1-like [Wyeomyia smithii]
MLGVLVITVVVLTTSAQESDRISSCRDVRSHSDGVYRIFPNSTSMPPFFAYCENSVEGGGWTVIHRRFDDSVPFNRSWIDYKYGFGNLQGEFWLGLENMHQLTRAGHHQLLIVARDAEGFVRTALFERFSVWDEFHRYQIRIGPYIGGNLTYTFELHDGSKFSTPDTGEYCASAERVGWWFTQCAYVFLNNPIGETGMYWSGFPSKLMEARMLTREFTRNAATCDCALNSDALLKIVRQSL